MMTSDPVTIACFQSQPFLPEMAPKRVRRLPASSPHGDAPPRQRQRCRTLQGNPALLLRPGHDKGAPSARRTALSTHLHPRQIQNDASAADGPRSSAIPRRRRADQQALLLATEYQSMSRRPAYRPPTCPTSWPIGARDFGCAQLAPGNHGARHRVLLQPTAEELMPRLSYRVHTRQRCRHKPGSLPSTTQKRSPGQECETLTSGINLSRGAL